jgi:hypothetical protein
MAGKRRVFIFVPECVNSPAARGFAQFMQLCQRLGFDRASGAAAGVVKKPVTFCPFCTLLAQA